MLGVGCWVLVCLWLLVALGSFFLGVVVGGFLHLYLADLSLMTDRPKST